MVCPHLLRLPRLSLLVISIVSIVSVQCKQRKDAESRPKTLDNIANVYGQKIKHACGIDYSTNSTLPPNLEGIEKSLNIDVPVLAKGLKNDVVGALASVPRALIKMFFVVLHGQIVVGDAAGLCKTGALSDGQKKFLGTTAVTACWLSPKNNNPLRLVVSSDADTIRSSVLRLFAMWESEFIMDGLVAATVPSAFDASEWKSYAEAFVTERNKIADAFLNDMTNQFSADLDQLTEEKNADPKAFANLVYANAVDSYYCSAETRNEFSTKFKATWAVFTDANSKYNFAKELGRPG